MTSAFRPGGSPLLRAAETGRLNELVSKIDGFNSALAVADRADEMATELAAEPARDTNPQPATPEELTTEWLAKEVEQRRYGRATEESLTVLQEIAVTARQQAAELIERHATDLIRGLAQQLEKVREAAAKAVDQLGAGVNDPVAAINADVAQHWKTLVCLRGEYDAIRSAQKAVYLYTGEGTFDQLRCGDNQPLINDPEARLYFHRNLTTVAPRWRGGIDTDRREHVGEIPWPDDPVERLVWFIRNDSGIWCPTRGEIKTLLAEGGAGPDPKTRGAQVPRLTERGHATKEGAKPDLWNTPVEMAR